MKPVYSLIQLLTFWVLACFTCLPLHAASSQIQEVQITGSQQIETSQILFSLESQAGDGLDRQKIINDIKTIYKLELFQNIRVEIEPLDQGQLLRFVVVERPRIQAIRYEGRTLLSESAFEEEMTLKRNDIYDPVKAQRNAKIIQDEYHKSGYPQARVTYRIEEVSTQEYILYFVVQESPKTYLTDIRIYETTVFSELELRRMMLSAEVDCFSWISDSGVYQVEKINQDLALITQTYLQQGYIKVFIPKPSVTLYHNPDYSWLSVKMSVQEGPQYFAGKVDIAGDILGDKEDLLKKLQLKEGEVYNPFLQNQDRFILSETYQERGYAFARVIPRTKVHEDTKRVDVTYYIAKKKKAYLGRIQFAGNTSTRDYVIRREFIVNEGELYNGKKLRETRENLERLGFFEPGFAMDQDRRLEEDNILDVTTRLKEAQTGTFQAQLGFSEQSRLSGALSLSKNNLFGRGQSVSLSLQFAERGVQNNFSLSFREPRLFSTLISTGFSVSIRRVGELRAAAQRARQENAYSISAGVPVYRRWFRFTMVYRAVDRLFTDNDIPALIKRTLAMALSYNTVNHPVFPSKGINTDFTVSQTGTPFGGNTRFREYAASYQQFWGLNKDRTFILMSRLRVGFLESIGNFEIPAEDRYFIGGIQTIRGHDVFAIAGPRGRSETIRNQERESVINEIGSSETDLVDERIADNNLSSEEIRQLRPGGISQRIYNLELLFPLSSDVRSNMRGVVFFDAGNVNSEHIQYKLLNEKEPEFWDVRTSIGLGFRLITPVGVFRFEYGQKLDQQPGEAPDKFEFNISGLF